MKRIKNAIIFVGEFFDFYKTVFLILVLIIGVLGFYKIKNIPWVLAYNTNVNSSDYDPAGDPQVNPQLHTYSSNGAKGYYNADHRIDDKKPCFSFLLDYEGNHTYPPQSNLPPVSNTWTINRIKDIDHDGSWKGSNAVSFDYSGPVYLPPSGYHVDQAGHQATILYADSNNITVAYTADGSIAYGYVITIRDMNVNSELVDLYKNARENGSLGAIGGKQVLGNVNSNSKFLIRDTGAILDILWQDDWWECNLSAIDDENVVDPAEIGFGKRILWGQCVMDGANDSIFRPHPCDNCETIVPDYSLACAETVEMKKGVDYSCYSEGESCTLRTWTGNIKADTEDFKVPFAGYKGILIGDDQSRSVNPNNYINDYFEGVAMYNGEKYDPESEEMRYRYFWEMGVIRKITAKELQDNLRIKLIEKGYDYEISNGEIMLELIEWKNEPYAFNGSDGSYPPERDKDYEKNLEKWEKTDYGKLWPYIPFFSREDAPGKLIVEIEHDPGKLDAGGGHGGTKIDDYTVEYAMAFPHLTRLYESSKFLNSLLMPEEKQESLEARVEKQEFAKSKNGVILAQARSESVEEEAEITTEEVSETDPMMFCEDLGHDIDGDCDKENPLKDENENDSACCDSDIEFNIENYPIIKKCEYKRENGEIVYDELGNPKFKDTSAEIKRKIATKIEVPYLEKIWEYTTAPETGFFNIFRVNEGLPEFPEEQALSKMEYVVTSEGDGDESFEVEVYYPYLGGVQIAKKCVSESLFVPSELQGENNWCDWEEE